MAERVLTERDLNRALLARQLLLERARVPIARAVERIGGIQAQYAPSLYVGLWTRVDGVEREAVTRALERRTLVQATLMRVTIHVVSRREFWRYAAGVRRARQAWFLRVHEGASEREMEAAAERLRAALADGPRSAKELGELAQGFLGNAGLWVETVRVPPSGTWERRRADVLALAEDWVGPCDAGEEEGLDHLLRAYLRAFGPAPLRDAASWAGTTVTALRPSVERLRLRRFRDEAGGELLDVPGAPLPDPATPAPVRFLPHWDACLLAHARRTGVLPERYRARLFHVRRPFSAGAVLVDGRVAGEWSVRDGRVVVEAYERLPRAVEDERARLEAFHA